MLPPTSVTRASAASARKPSSSACASAAGNAAGSPRESSASRGVPPIAAMSDRLTASAFQPMSAAVLKRRSKWTPSTSASVVRISSAPRSGLTTAASSPMPTVSHPGAGGTRARISAMRPRSPDGWLSPSGGSTRALAGVLDRPGFTDDRDFDLTGILQLVLDPLGDVLREPDGLFVRDGVALDHDADLAAGLQGKRLGHAVEGVGDALQLLQPLDVGLEDVAARAGTGGGDGVGRLHDHRLERRPVDVHVVRGDRLQYRLALAVL